MSTTEELAYLAGMLDADGSIDLRVKSQGNLLLRAQVYNTNRELMDWLMATFGVGSISTAGRATQGNRWKPEYTWYVTGNKARALLDSIAPYMVVKRARALLAIEAWDNRTPTPVALRRQPIPPQVVEMRAGYVSRMREMNRTGIAEAKGA